VRGGAAFVNSFTEMPHRRATPWAAVDYTAREHVATIHRHLLEVWCTGDRTQYDYLLNWLAHAVTGHKLRAALYVRSGQGTGKSIVTEFIRNAVLSARHVLISNDRNTILGDFNAQTADKVLVILEDVPITSTGEWLTLSQKMKHLITASHIEINAKYRTPYQVANHSNYMILANNNALAVDGDDRRFCCLDVSPARVGDRRYFDQLAAAVAAPGVGAAFYQWAVAHCESAPAFDGSVIPRTLAKRALVQAGMHDLFKYILDHYLRHGLDLGGAFSTFYELYKSRCDAVREKVLTRNLVSERLKEAGILTGRKDNITQIQPIDFVTLRGIFDAKGWLSEADDIPTAPAARATALTP
jgi:hypothetical protein